MAPVWTRAATDMSRKALALKASRLAETCFLRTGAGPAVESSRQEDDPLASGAGQQLILLNLERLDENLGFWAVPGNEVWAITLLLIAAVVPKASTTFGWAVRSPAELVASAAPTFCSGVKHDDAAA